MNNFIYRIRLDFELFDQYIDYYSLKDVFDLLKSKGHIHVLKFDENTAELLEKAEELAVNIDKNHVYIETSTSLEGIFCKSIDFWIENSLIDEFYYPDKRPYIEVLINN